MRASKFDLFILEGKFAPFTMCWDTATNGVPEYYHTDGMRSWRGKGRDHYAKMRKNHKLLARIPEHVFREIGAAETLKQWKAQM